MYFATIKEKDGENDRASHLDRPGIFRFNLGLPSKIYEAQLGPRPPRPAKGQTIEGPWDFAVADQLLPHPVYAWMGWVAVVNPSAATFTGMKPLVDAAYARVQAAFKKRERLT